MKLININNLEFLGGTYDNYNVARYVSINYKGDERFTINIRQGFDKIIFIDIYYKTHETNFINNSVKH